MGASRKATFSSSSSASPLSSPHAHMPQHIAAIPASRGKPRIATFVICTRALRDVRYLGYLEFELELRTATHRAVTMRNRCHLCCHLCSSLCSGGSSQH